MAEANGAFLSPWVNESVPQDPVLLSGLWPASSVFSGWPSIATQKRLKSLVRRSVPAGSREALWLTVTGGTAYQTESPSLYSDTIKNMFGEGQGNNIQCPSAFCPSGGCVWWHLSDTGRSAACRILLAVERARPDVTTCPQLQPVVAIALHFIAEEKDCFYLAMSLLRKHDKRRRPFVNQTHLAVKVARRNFASVARKKAKRSYQWLLGGIARRSNLSPSAVSHDLMFKELANWDEWIIRELPFSTTVRVIDCFFVEGCKVFYRVAMAMMKTCFRHLAKSGELVNAEPSVQTVIDFCQKVNTDDLLKCGFAIRNFSHNLLDKANRDNRALLSSSVEQTDSLSPTTSEKAAPIAVSIKCATIKDNELWNTIWQWFPARYQITQPRRLFCTDEDGYSLKTLYDRCDDEEPLLLLVRTVEQDVFGAFLSSSLKGRLSGKKAFSYFGTGQTFLFSLKPSAAFYQWVGISGDTANAVDYFLAGDNTCFVVGGGDGYGLWLDASLDHGTSSRCTTFNNEPLISQTGNDFRCAAVEVFGFSDS